MTHEFQNEIEQQNDLGFKIWKHQPKYLKLEISTKILGDIQQT